MPDLSPANRRLWEETARFRDGQRERPAHIATPEPGQESVWDYPRPPRVEPVSLRLRVVFAGDTIADTTRGLRVVETAGAPVYYFPPDDVRVECLIPSTYTSVCEWKGASTHWTVRVNGRSAEDAAWSYEDPFPDYRVIIGYVAFYAAKMDACYVGEERVRPQPGGFYGGWVTANLTGPIKGEPASDGW